MLCSLDYDSMFTNVDVDEAAAVIAEFYHLIADETCVPITTFLKCVREIQLISVHCMLFTSNAKDSPWEISFHNHCPKYTQTTRFRSQYRDMMPQRFLSCISTSTILSDTP